jgi:hypothetical protein
MATRTWMLGLWLGLVGFSLATGCVVKSDDDDGSGGEAGDDSGGTSSGGSSGSATGGKGGSSTGGSSTGGSSTGGSSTGGSSTGGSSTGGTGGMDEVECDPDEGELDNTPYPNCTASQGNECEQCIEQSCCALSRVCYGTEPMNVCGWGGPDGAGEIACYIECIAAYYEDNAVYDDDGRDLCTNMCTTQMCGLIGNATQDMVECVDENCEADCYGIEP